MRAARNRVTGNDIYGNFNILSTERNIFPGILNTLEEPLFLFDSRFKIVWHNKACNDLYEYVSDKPIDCSFDFNELLTTEQQCIFNDHLHKVLAGEKAHFEWRYKQSVTKWLSVSLYPFTEEGGDFTGICGSLRDITDKKINELVLLRNTTVLNNISDAVVYTDMEQRVAYINKNAEKIYEVTPDEIMGRRFFDVVAFEYIDDVKSNVERTIIERATWEGKVVHGRKDGKKVYLLASITPLTDKHGNIIGLIAAHKDITGEEINRQQSLRHQDNVSAVINNITEGVLLVDRDFTILEFNQRAYTHEIKIDTKLHVGKKITDLLPEYRKEPVLRYFEATLEGRSVEYEVLYPDNTWLLINFIPVKNDKGDIHRIIITSRDITERKKAEELITANERKYRTLVNSLSEGVILQTMDNEMLTANNSAAQILGVSAEHLKQNGFFCTGFDIIDENENKVIPDLLFFKKSGKANQFRNQVIGLQKPDYVQWLRLNSASVRNSTDNDYNAVVISFEDITEQKRISREVEVLSMVAKEIDNAVCILLPDGHVSWVNEGFTRLTGFGPEEIIGTRTRQMFWGPDTDPAIHRKMAFLRDKGLPFREEVLIYTKDRRKLWTIVQGQPIRDSKGTLSGYFSLVTDVTEEKKILQEMEVLSMVAKETSNSVIIFEKDSNGYTLWVNEGFSRITGFSPEDIIGKNPVSILTGPDTDRSVLKYIENRMAINLPYYVELIIYTKDGRKRLHQINGQPIKNADGLVAKYFAIGTDITEQRRMEHDRLQKEVEQQKEISRVILQTQESERNELGRELHDNINQILGAVMLELSFCLSAESKTSKPVLTRSIENLQEAITEIRNLSHRMVMPRFTESALVQELNGLISKYHHVETIQLEATEWREDQIPNAIKETFFRITQEQLNNIWKHAKATKINIQLKSDNECAFMSIKDDGIGFDTRQKRKGIGITNILNRVDSYNGHSWFVSEPGRGCVLSVSIPLASTI